MGGAELTVLVVDDDFRVANMHAGIVNAMPGFTVAGTANTLAAARQAEPVDLALVDVYLPDGSGIDFVRELHCDAMVLTAATESETIRAALAAGAVSYLVKPFATTELAARLAGYARYRKILAGANLRAGDVDAALDALRPKVAPAPTSTTAASPPNSLSCRLCKPRSCRCRPRKFPRRSGSRGRRLNGIWRRWRPPGTSPSDCATARRDDLNRNSRPVTAARLGRHAEHHLRHRPTARRVQPVRMRMICNGIRPSWRAMAAFANTQANVAR